MAVVQGIILALFCVSFSTSVLTLKQPKVYYVDLDAPAEDRWKQIMLENKNAVTFSHAIVRKSLPAFTVNLVEDIAGSLNKYLPSPYAEEMKGIADVLNMTLGDVVLINLFYDLTAHCTSIVAEDLSGKIWHARNLDFPFTEMLRKETVHVNFMKNGQILYSGITFPGYVGLLTGLRPHGFTVTIDERDLGAALLNYWIELTDNHAMPVTFLVRNVLENNSSFHSAIKTLSNTDTAAAVYFIIAGVKPGEGAVITKERLHVDNVWYMNQTKDKWFIVETNYDHWNSTPKSDKRRETAIRSIRSMGRNHINKENLLKVLSVPPVLQNKTIYSVVMSAADPQVFTTWIRGP